MPNSPAPEQHNCVLCNAKLPTKEELQDHFRKHANKEIDGKGRPIKSRFVSAGRPPAGATKVVASPAATSSSSGNSGASRPRPSGKKLAQPIACDVCGQEFDTVTMAIQHKFRKHPNSAIKHFCPYCGMQFPLKINCDMHLDTHPEPRPKDPFPCDECGVMFFTSQAQNYHYRSTHKRIVAFFKPVVTPPPSKKIRLNNAGEAQSVFYCHLCGYEYIVKFNLQKHLERQHSEDERNEIPKDLVRCTTCDALFYNKKAYENHNMYHKPDDLYVTSEEQRLQTVTRVDQDFDIRRVQPQADKFIPVYRPKPVMDLKTITMTMKSKKGGRKGSQQEDSDSELSPDSCSMSDSSDSDEPLQQRVSRQKKTKAASAKEPPPAKKQKKVSSPEQQTEAEPLAN